MSWPQRTENSEKLRESKGDELDNRGAGLRSDLVGYENGDKLNVRKIIILLC
jgi:hypothetical protein